MLSSVSSKFDLLPTRPPTPPRETSQAIDDAISFLDDSNEIDRLLSGPQKEQSRAVAVQESALATCHESENTTNAGRKVGFSPHPVYYRAAPEHFVSPKGEPIKRSLSITSHKPLRSILKPASVVAPLTPEDLDSKLGAFSPEIPGSFAKMLQSVIQQLASTSRSSRLDAYLALNGALKAYEGVPDVAAMTEKMTLLMQFIARDMAWKDSEGKLDINMITQAIKLTNAILFDPKLVETLDDDFRSFVVDRSIAVLEKDEMPKPLIKAHIFVLAQQRFRPYIMTAAKAEKLLTVLRSVEERCSGNSVITTRLMVYERLFKQVPGVMLSRIRDWIDHVFHGMLSSIKEIRSKAIETCNQAGLSFGQHSYAGKALHEFFETEVEDGETYCEYLTSRLIEMIADKEAAVQVPQIWSSVILFFRKRKSLENWATFKPWLRIIQRCHNSSDINIKYQALLAWNKVVFAIMPDSATSEGVMSLLKLPICAGLKKSGNDKFSQQVRHYSLDSYCNLLHYALRPGLSNEDHDNAWDMFVDPVLAELVKFSGKGRYIACRIVYGFVNGNTGVWNPNVAVQHTSIKPEDLPKLDPRWIRSRLAKILKLLERPISTGMWSSPDANATLDAIWQHLMRSIADAGGQEVRTSNDLKQSIALLIAMLRRIWIGCASQPSEADPTRWLSRYTSLVETMIASLGAGPFIEDILSTTVDDVIEVAPTPSHRHSKSHGTPQSPLLILYGLFYHPPDALIVDETYESSAFSVLKALVSSKSSFQPRLDLLSRDLQTWRDISGSEMRTNVKEHLWTAVARNAMLVLKPELSPSSGQDSQNLGSGLRSAMDILILGLEHTAIPSAYDVVEELYDAIQETAKTSTGDGSVVLAAIEPFAKALLRPTASPPFLIKLRFACHMLDRAVWPRSRQVMEQARKSLWGVGLAPHKSATFDPFEHMYALITDLSKTAYNGFETCTVPEKEALPYFFASVVDFLNKSPTYLLAPALRKSQDAFITWMEDRSGRTGSDRSTSEFISIAWANVVALLLRLPGKDNNLLKAVEDLFVAGFSSPHRAVVNKTILFWNDTFGAEESLEYPPKLENTLRALAMDAEISLPTFPQSHEESIPASLPAFYDSYSQEYVEPVVSKPITRVPQDRKHLSVSSPLTRSPYFVAQRSPLNLRSNWSSPANKHSRRPASTTPKAKLRHDNSQIQFAPIDSSPLPREDESQLLTEHQREVQARQHQDAQLFPDMSSSPMAQSTALPKAVPRRLDFTSIGQRSLSNVAPGTPDGLPVVSGLMSDDIPSSPTPSSARDASQGAADVDDDDEMESAMQDPPSSPPRAKADKVDEPIKNRKPRVPGVQDKHIAEDEQDGKVVTVGLEARKEDFVSSEFPSDSQLPTMQLQEEEAAAAVVPTTVRGVEQVDASREEDHHLRSEDAEAETQETDEVRSSAPEDEVTRIKNSFIGPDGIDARTSSTSNSGSQSSQRAGKKRRRSKPLTVTARKRKQQPDSPLKRVSSYIDEDDEDIGEEIVVASSQRSSSPIGFTASENVSSPAPLDDAEDMSVVVKDEPEPVGMPPPIKRGPGRPRKSQTPTVSPSRAGPSRTLKRKASTLSNASTVEDQVPSSLVKVTPSPSKKRRGRPRITNKGVVEERTSQESVLDQDHEKNDTATPDQQLRTEQGAAALQRPIATPRSMLKRLKDAMMDLKGMILGSQEERQFDDVLYEFRREVHEAGRRGRE